MSNEFPDPPKPEQDERAPGSPKTFRELNDVIASVLESQYPDRRIEVMTLLTSASNDVTPIENRLPGIKKNTYDLEAQKTMVARVMWSYVRNMEYRGPKVTREVFTKRRDAAPEKEQAYMDSILTLCDSLIEKIEAKL
jgi:hypothetical protein